MGSLTSLINGDRSDLPLVIHKNSLYCIYGNHILITNDLYLKYHSLLMNNLVYDVWLQVLEVFS